MIRTFVWLVVIVTLVVCGATVKLGKRTFFGHVAAVWKTDEAQDMKEGIKEKAGPVVEDVKHKAGPTFDKVKRGVEAGVKEAVRDDASVPAKTEAKHR